MSGVTDVSCEVLHNVEEAVGTWRLGLSVPTDFRQPPPGTFAMLKIDSSPHILLRRPFTYYNFEDNSVEFLYQVVGKGTSAMAALKKGNSVGVLGPLGNPFPIPGKDVRRVWMIAGGIGVATFPLLLRAIAETGKSDLEQILVYGVPSSNAACSTGIFEKAGAAVKIVTEDGSSGSKGLPTDILKSDLGKNDVVYACGPVNMLKAVKEIALNAGAQCWLSLDSRMACGLGACMGCAVESNNGYALVCKDGPVFDAREVFN